MDASQIYALDVEGYIVVPGALSPEERAAATNLHLQPVLRRLVEDILASGALNICTTTSDFRLDQGPVELRSADDGRPDFSAAAAAQHHQVDGLRLCYGVAAVFALEENMAEDCIVVVPSSHNSTLAPPDLTEDDMGATLPVPLQAGDLLLAASTLMLSTRGYPRGLIKLELCPATSFPSAGIPPLNLERQVWAPFPSCCFGRDLPMWLVFLSHLNLNGVDTPARACSRRLRGWASSPKHSRRWCALARLASPAPGPRSCCPTARPPGCVTAHRRTRRAAARHYSHPPFSSAQPVRSAKRSLTRPAERTTRCWPS
jgi:hypothetical protein